MKKYSIYAITVMAVLLSSCATYHISTASLLTQLAGTQKEKKVLIFVAPPFFFPGVVNGNSLRTVTVLDKNEKEHEINVTGRTGVRITMNSGKKTTFYFNTLLIKDSTITGSKTHFFNAPIRPISLSNIAKIQIQK